MGRAVLRTGLGHLQPRVRPVAAGAPSPRVSTSALGDPLVYDLQLAGDDAPGCSADEAAFFRENGFIVKRSLLPSASLARGREEFWRHVPACIQRSDPSTWVDPERHAGWPEAQPEHSNLRNRPASATPGEPAVGSGDGKFFTKGALKLHAAGFEEWMLDMVPRQPAMLRTVEALIGAPVQRPRQNRGIYTVFPSSERGGGLGPHLDGQPWQLGSILLLDNCPPHCGGTTIWPGSHRQLYYEHEQEYNFTPRPSFGEAMQRIKATTRPVEFSGKAGDCIFFHHRVLHSGGINAPTGPGRSRPVIRLAVPTDWQKVFATAPAAGAAAGATTWTQVKVAEGMTVPVQPDGTVASYAGGGAAATPFARGSADWVDVLPWWVDARHHGWAPATPPREDQWADWALGNEY